MGDPLIRESPPGAKGYTVSVSIHVAPSWEVQTLTYLVSAASADIAERDVEELVRRHNAVDIKEGVIQIGQVVAVRTNSRSVCNIPPFVPGEPPLAVSHMIRIQPPEGCYEMPRVPGSFVTDKKSFKAELALAVEVEKNRKERRGRDGIDDPYDMEDVYTHITRRLRWWERRRR